MLELVILKEIVVYTSQLPLACMHTFMHMHIHTYMHVIRDNGLRNIPLVYVCVLYRSVQYQVS
jgi:hypothetical protein